ncbi:hypothetical protein BDD12DRAFT_423836 [Trichophaea hybrida]|nr:hypothetical protein BDD12DRAFT_423836 [Trichophaea hybrida]
MILECFSSLFMEISNDDRVHSSHSTPSGWGNRCKQYDGRSGTNRRTADVGGSVHSSSQSGNQGEIPSQADTGGKPSKPSKLTVVLNDEHRLLIRGPQYGEDIDINIKSLTVAQLAKLSLLYNEYEASAGVLLKRNRRESSRWQPIFPLCTHSK